VNALVFVADVEHAFFELILRREELAWIVESDLRNVLSDDVTRQHLLANARKRATFAQQKFEERVIPRVLHTCLLQRRVRLARSVARQDVDALWELATHTIAVKLTW
jgi:hypothetical protein